MNLDWLLDFSGWRIVDWVELAGILFVWITAVCGTIFMAVKRKTSTTKGDPK